MLKIISLNLLFLLNIISLLQITNLQSCEIFSCEEKQLTHEEKAMNILREFLNPEIHKNKKWHVWLDELIKELHHISTYKAFVQDLKKLKGEKNAYTVGRTLSNYKNLLDADLKAKIDYMYNNEPFKLYSIVSRRIKVN